MKRWVAAWLTAVAGSLVSMWTATAFCAEPFVEPEDVLREQDVRHGLAVVVGCGDGALAETLGKSFPGLLIHGLDADAAAVARGRTRILDGGRLYGRVSLEAWSHPRLPYASDMVSALVVHDSSSFDEEEMRRVVAPGGILCRKTTSGWTVWKKPVLGERVVASAGWYNWAAHRTWLYSRHLATGEIVWADSACSAAPT